ncbi:tail fiber domain-containing protein [Enterobacter hormaechei]|uniref:tail fiber domain-containing protein n=1 Tax=Enterobacter hormaechei TaxID=158836 RepID=UPI000798B535|nr:tail fiber domain-containing protein [Enterobacter hormaechei]CZU58237.1 putative tail fiber [Enterobacter hormaechei]CZW28676.1 putative tail fiber [Enterobacter hormaechei]
MIYTTGTIAISGNTLTGTGTNFTAAGSLIRNGCTVIAMTSPVQVFQITTIGSATSLTVTPAANPAVPAGTRFAILLSDSLSVDGLAQDIAETFTMYQRYMSGFADVMNGTSDVTITINGTAVTVPGQKSLAKKGANSDITSLSGLTTALSISQGGTGAKNAADARTNLGLGNAATKDVGPNTGNVLGVGYFGFGTPGINVLGSTESGFYGIDGSGTSWAPQAGSGIVCGYDPARRQQIFTGASGNLFVRNLASSAMNTPSSTIPWTQMQAVGTSDINFKKDITELDTEIALANIDAMEFVSFRYKDDDSEAVRRGVIAQQIEKIDPEYVHSAEGVGKMTLDLNPLLMDALAAIKALNAKVAELSKQVDELKQGGA